MALPILVSYKLLCYVVFYVNGVENHIGNVSIVVERTGWSDQRSIFTKSSRL